MLDKNLLDWQMFQQAKKQAKLAKMNVCKSFPCFARLFNSYIPAYMKIINNNDNYIHIVARQRMRNILAPPSLMKIPVNGIRGYDRRNENLIITFTENEEEVADPEMEIVEGPLILQFASPDVLSAAFAAITEFQREKLTAPTPSSSSSSESGEGHNN